MICKCGTVIPENTLQCSKCRREAMAKLIKIAALLGVILGFICSSLPDPYQTPCKAIAGVLATC